jgi:4-hydroxybenzoate polyprenyltransferase
MNPLAAFLKLVRWPNLFFIAFTQVLFFYCILPFVYRVKSAVEYQFLSPIYFFLIVIASIFIAAAGYIINDYFDLHIDMVNKPHKVVIEKNIKRRWAIVFHLSFSFVGFIISCYVGYKISNIYIPFINLISIALLWFYSTTFKKKLLIGNVIISLLTAWVIFVLTFAEFTRANNLEDVSIIARLLKLSILYAGFAFVISLIREVIKDMEDMNGDAKYNCRTMPIVWGIPVSKVFTAVWIIVLIGTTAVLQFYVLQLGWWLSALYSFFLIILPLIWILKKLYAATVTSDYSDLSKAVKLVMFTGILSMLFFRIYL